MNPSGEGIPGYDFGKAASAVSPLTEEERDELEQAAGWTAEDAALLRKHAGLFQQQAEAMVDSWRAVIGAQPHLAKWFFGPDGKPDDDYKARVKQRFVQWVVDVATRPHDRDWLNYQQEIGLRHTPTKKNTTDGAHTPPVVPLRFLLSFLPVVLPVRSFFADAVSDPGELEALQAAWTRAVLLHVTLWTRPYTLPDLW